MSTLETCAHMPTSAKYQAMSTLHDAERLERKFKLTKLSSSSEENTYTKMS